MPTLTINGNELYYSQSGTGKTTVVFVHGFSCDSTDWRYQTVHLASNCETLALDLNGHGCSQIDLHSCTIETFADDVITLVERLGQNPVTLVGHSMGCRVVLQALSRRPDLFKAAVLVDGGRLATKETLDTFNAEIQSMLSVVGYQEFIKQMFEQMFLHDKNVDLKQAVIERALSLPAEVGLQIAKELFRWDALELEKVLSTVRVPTLVIQTSDDTDVKRRSLKRGERTPWLDLLAQYLDHSQLEITVIPETGHFAMLERPAEVNRLLDGFLVVGNK